MKRVKHVHLPKLYYQSRAHFTISTMVIFFFFLSRKEKVNSTTSDFLNDPWEKKRNKQMVKAAADGGGQPGQFGFILSTLREGNESF